MRSAGDTTGLDKALKDTNKNIKSTQDQLKDVERLLKLDPSNTELLSQKQKLLAQPFLRTERQACHTQRCRKTSTAAVCQRGR